MSKVIQQFQRYALLRSILYVLTGIFAIMYPKEFTQGIIYLIAGYVAILGIMNLWNAYQEKRRSGYVGFEMIVGILLLVAAAAILALAKPIFTIMTIFLGILIVLNGILRIVQGFNLKGLNQRYLPWIFYGALLVVGGLLLMFKAVASIMTLFGSLLIFMGISEIVGYIQIVALNLPRLIVSYYFKIRKKKLSALISLNVVCEAR